MYIYIYIQITRKYCHGLVSPCNFRPIDPIRILTSRASTNVQQSCASLAAGRHIGYHAQHMRYTTEKENHKSIVRLCGQARP